MKAYIVPDWLTIVAGLVIHRNQQVLMGLRSARLEAGKWCLPTGLGAIRRDVSSFLANGSPGSLEEPMRWVQFLSERHQQAFLSPAGFALAEARWYIEIPSKITPEQLKPLKPICQLSGAALLVKVYFGLEWKVNEPPNPAKTEWPFAEVRFFSRQELKNIPIAFGCGEDLDICFWSQLKARTENR